MIGGTIFSITQSGAFKTLYNFTGGADGQPVWAPLVDGTDGNFYGTNHANGSLPDRAEACGVIFEITRTGMLTTLHSLTADDGCSLYNGLVQATNGRFYGTTSLCGSVGYGTAFSLDTGPRTIR